MPSYLTRNGTSGIWLFIYIETYLHTSLAYIPAVIGKNVGKLQCYDVGNIFGFKPKLIILRIMSCKLVLIEFSEILFISFSLKRNPGERHSLLWVLVKETTDFSDFRLPALK